MRNRDKVLYALGFAFGIELVAYGLVETYNQLRLGLFATGFSISTSIWIG